MSFKEIQLLATSGRDFKVNVQYFINWYNVNIPTYWGTNICFVPLYNTDSHQKMVVMRNHDESKLITSWEGQFDYIKSAQCHSHYTKPHPGH